MKNKLRLISLILIPFFHLNSANAAQIVEVTEDAEVKVVISSYDLNRIKIQGGKVDGFRALKGDLLSVSDSKSGELYVSMPSKYSKKITNLFVTSSSGATFKLLLVPRKIPSEQIFLVEQSSSTNNAGGKIYDSYRDDLISFYLKLYQRKVIDSYKISYKKKYIKKKNIKAKRVASYIPTDPKNFKGEIYQIKNRSKEPLMLDAKDFYKNGVRAVKLDKYYLNKGEKTMMYIISN